MSPRIFTIVESFDGQAVESWLTRLVEAGETAGRRDSWIFYTLLPHEGRLEPTVRRLGAQVLRSSVPLRETRRFLGALRGAMRAHPADVLHCHHDLLSGLYLFAARGLPFRKRIVHVHNTTLALPTSSRLKARLARPVLRQLCLRLADHIVGVSGAARDALVGGAFSVRRRDLVIPAAVDTTRFVSPAAARAATRAALGVPRESTLLLFVGRLVPAKNPLGCVEILEHLVRGGRDAVLVLAGQGPEDAAVRKAVARAGLSTRVFPLGWHDDVPALMLAADVLLSFAPERPQEGLGLVMLEAQAAGLTVVATRSFPEEAVVVPELVHWIDFRAGAGAWAEVVERALAAPRPSRDDARSRVEASPAGLASSSREVFFLYDETPRSGRPGGGPA